VVSNEGTKTGELGTKIISSDYSNISKPAVSQHLNIFSYHVMAND